MKNPYEHDWLEDEVVVGRAGLRLGLAAFLLFLLVPAFSLLVPSLRPGDSGRTSVGLKARLSSWEQAAKTLPLLESWRESDQALLTAALGSGNAKVFAGRGGWLYYRPDLEAVFGKGPYHTEPPSVARERHDRAWQPPVPVIKDFAARLAERNISLVFVPVPTKAMVCREGLGLDPGIVPPPSWSRVAEDLAAAGIGFVDLLPVISARGKDDERFLRQDTHWTPETMEAAAREIATRVARGPVRTPGPVEALIRESRGDLVGMLDLGAEGESVFQPESVTLHRVAGGGAATGAGEDAEVVLLGDSFVNVYEDPALGFGVPGEASIGAGFASHFADALGQPVHTIAINGGGASAVREAFAALPAERLARVRTVVWVLSARDVLLPELAARRAGIEWRRVGIGGANTTAPSTPEARAGLLATLREKSPIEDPNLTPYTSAIYSALFETEDGGERLVFLWAFRNRKLEPSSVLEPGRRYRLRLTPLEGQAEANRATRLDDLFRPDLIPEFAVEVEPVE